MVDNLDFFTFPFFSSIFSSLLSTPRRRMLLARLGLLVITALPAWGHPDIFEPNDFDPTQALLDLGFDAAALPKVSATTERSHACHAAVRTRISIDTPSQYPLKYTP